jgi:hypothetical protein
MIKNLRCIMDKDAIAYSLEFYKLLRVCLNNLLCLGMGFLMISCTTIPKQTYLPKTSLSDVKKVAIIASAKAPEVHYSMQSEYSGVGYVIARLFGAAVEVGTRSIIDSHHASKIREHVDLNEIEYKAALAFIRLLQEGRCFEVIEYIREKDLNNSQLLAAGFDAVIRLSLRKISLESAPGRDIGLYAFMQGQMENLTSRKIIWDREEAVQSTEDHSLEYYKKNGLKEIDALLETACRRLAYDFVYR